MKEEPPQKPLVNKSQKFPRKAVRLGTEARYRDLVENSPSIFLRMEAQGKILFLNKFALKFFGYAKKEIIGRNAVGTIFPAREVSGFDLLARLREVAGQPQGYYTSRDESILANGDRVWITWTFRGVRGKDGQIVEFIGVGIDRTEQKRVEEALRQSENLLHNIFKAIPDLVTVHDRDFNIVMSNWSGYEHLGPEVRGSRPKCYEAYMKRDSPCEFCHVGEVFQSGQPKKIRRANPLLSLHREINAYPVYDESGQVSLVVEHVRDITEHVKAEEALAACQTDYQAVFNAANDAIFLLDPETGKILDVNERIGEMFGYTLEEARQLRVEDLGLGEPPPSQIEALECLGEAAAGAPRLFERLCKDKSGRLFWVEVNLKRALIGGQDRLLAIVRDITTRKEAEEALRASEQKFRLVTETIQDVFWMSNPQLDKIVYVSPAYEQIWGRTPASLLESPQSFRDAIHPEDRARVLATISQGHSQGTPWEQEYRLIRPDGSIRWIYDRGFPIKDEQGHVHLMTGVATDITVRRQAEAALRESEERYRILAENVQDVIWTTDLNLNFTYISPSAALLTGYTLEELHGLKLEQLLTPESLELAKKTLSRQLALADREKGELPVETLELEHIRKDGSLAWVEVKASFLTDAHGRPVGILGVSRDLTERKRAEDALRAAHHTLTALIQASPLAIIALDPEGRVLMWTGAAEKIFGWKEPEVLGKPLPFVPKEKLVESWELRERVMRGESLTGVELTRQKRDGAPIEISLFAAPLHSAPDEAVGVMALCADVTERKKLEEQLRQAQKMEAVGRLAGGIAHDFNNLLTAIMGYGEILMMDFALEDPSRKKIDEIARAAKRAASLTRQLLAFSRKQILQPRLLDLNTVVSDLENMLRRLIGEDIDLSVILDPSLGPVKADPGQIEQVIMNLIVNARDAMPLGGELIIETANLRLGQDYANKYLDVIPGPYVMLKVKDTGAGMDKETLAQIFEPFFTTKEAGKGTGLGLSTVYGIIKQSGGHIEVESEPGEGTAFKIYLPRVGEVSEALGQRPDSVPTLEGSETILVVEDEDILRTMICQVLRHHGYKVLGARHGGEALQICERRKEKIHLMLTDLVLPKMNGGELAKYLSNLYPEMKVIYMSGYLEDSMGHKELLDPDIPFLAKPFKPITLLQKVREVLNHPR